MKAYSKICDLKLGKHVSINFVLVEYYKILELEYGSDFSSIKKAYKRLLKKYHPDLFQNKPEKLKSAQEVTRQINEAYTYFERKFLWIY